MKFELSIFLKSFLSRYNFNINQLNFMYTYPTHIQIRDNWDKMGGSYLYRNSLKKHYVELGVTMFLMTLTPWYDGLVSSCFIFMINDWNDLVLIQYPMLSHQNWMLLRL